MSFFQIFLLTQCLTCQPYSISVLFSGLLGSHSLLSSFFACFFLGICCLVFLSTSPHTTLDLFPPTNGYFSVSVLFPQEPAPSFSLSQLSVLISRALVFWGTCCFLNHSFIYPEVSLRRQLTKHGLSWKVLSFIRGWMVVLFRCSSFLWKGVGLGRPCCMLPEWSLWLLLWSLSGFGDRRWKWSRKYRFSIQKRLLPRSSSQVTFSKQCLLWGAPVRPEAAWQTTTPWTPRHSQLLHWTSHFSGVPHDTLESVFCLLFCRELSTLFSKCYSRKCCCPL